MDIYEGLLLAHAVGASITVGAALFWLPGAVLIRLGTGKDERLLKLSSYAGHGLNAGGLVLICSGVGLLAITDWFFAAEGWFVLAILLIVAMIAGERRFHAPAEDMLSVRGQAVSDAQVSRAKKRVFLWACIQAAVIGAVLLLMLTKPEFW